MARPATRLAMLALLAVGLVAAAVAAFGQKDPAPDLGTGLAAVADTKAMLRGIPQQGNALGDPDAPVALVEFADLQCPFCMQYHRDVLPALLERYVRTGEVRLVLQPLQFIGPDSTELAETAAAAAAHGRLWHVAGLAFANQGAENGGWATSEFLDDLARAAGLDGRRLQQARYAGAGRGILERAEAEAARNHIEGTPSFLVARRGEKLEHLQPADLTLAAFTAALDELTRR